MYLVAVWQQQVHTKYCYHLQNYILSKPKSSQPKGMYGIGSSHDFKTSNHGTEENCKETKSEWIVYGMRSEPRAYQI